MTTEPFDKEKNIFERLREKDNIFYSFLETANDSYIFNSIKYSNNWKDNSGKGDPPPDYINSEDKLAMDIMRINNWEYIKDGKPQNPQKDVDVNALKEIYKSFPFLDKDSIQPLIIVHDESIVKNKERHLNMFKRVVSEKHDSQYSNYRKNHPECSQIILMILDESENIKYCPLLDEGFINIIKDLRSESLVWYFPYTSIDIIIPELNEIKPINTFILDLVSMRLNINKYLDIVNKIKQNTIYIKNQFTRS